MLPVMNLSPATYLSRRGHSVPTAFPKARARIAHYEAATPIPPKPSVSIVQKRHEAVPLFGLSDSSDDGTLNARTVFPYDYGYITEVPTTFEDYGPVIPLTPPAQSNYGDISVAPSVMEDDGYIKDAPVETEDCGMLFWP